MRTTVTLDADTESVVRRRMQEKSVSFKQALNDAIRAGATDRAPVGAPTEPRAMGRPAVVLDRALQLAGELEDEEIVRQMRSGR